MLQQSNQMVLVSLSDFLDKWLVLYFYLKDGTPGCTVEAKDSKYVQEFSQLGAQVIGVSTDSQQSHCKFIAKHNKSDRTRSALQNIK